MRKRPRSCLGSIEAKDKQGKVAFSMVKEDNEGQ